METDLWELKFGVQVSAVYHDWRRAALARRIRLARSATLFGAILTLATGLVTLLVPMPFFIAALPVIFALLIAVINLWELTSRWDDLALEHTGYTGALRTCRQRC